MSGTGTIWSDTAAAGITEGGPTSPATSVLTAYEIQTMILSALRLQEENLFASSRLLPSGGNVNVENVETTPLA